jgi:hypothetical protein
LPELHARWPRLGLVPTEALLQLLEQLPAYFRAGASQRHVQLPMPVLDTLFNGARSLLPVVPPAFEQWSNSQQQHDDALGIQTSSAHLPKTMMSGCWHEPLSVTETAALADTGGLHIAALSTCPHHRCKAAVVSAIEQDVLVGCCGEDLILGFSGTIAGPRGHDSHHQCQNPVNEKSQKLAAAAGTACSSVDAGGVHWGADDCPAAVLHMLHDAAGEALRRQTAQALHLAGQLPVSCAWKDQDDSCPSSAVSCMMQSVTGRCHGTLCSVNLDAHGPLPWLTLQVAVWAGSCCGQALLLADNVLWTRAATASLQQLASGNNHALQALGDSAALQLETIAGALRQCKSTLAAASSVIVQHEEQEVQTPGSSRAICREASSFQQMQVPCVFNTEKGPSGSPGTESAGCTMNTAALSRAQLFGLQILIGNAVSHREVAAELRAAGVTGPTDFEWGKQLRFYWDPEPSQLQVKVVWLVCRLQCLLTCLSAVAGSILLAKSVSAGSHMVQLHR